MILHLFILAQAQQNPIVSFLPLILIFLVFYFFIIRPQKKKEDERKKLIESASKGDRIVTLGGIHGQIMQVDTTSVLLQVDTNVKIRIENSSIGSVQNAKADKE